MSGGLLGVLCVGLDGREECGSGTKFLLLVDNACCLLLLVSCGVPLSVGQDSIIGCCCPEIDISYGGEERLCTPFSNRNSQHNSYASCRCRRGDGSVDFPGFSSNGRNLREHHNDSSNSSTRAHIHKTSTPVRTVSPKTEIAGRDCTTTSIDRESQRGKRGDNPSYELAQNGGRDSADLRVDRRMLWV